jgi:hypothetical protein
MNPGFRGQFLYVILGVLEDGLAELHPVRLIEYDVMHVSGAKKIESALQAYIVGIAAKNDGQIRRLRIVNDQGAPGKRQQRCRQRDTENSEPGPFGGGHPHGPRNYAIAHHPDGSPSAFILQKLQPSMTECQLRLRLVHWFPGQALCFSRS